MRSLNKPRSSMDKAAMILDKARKIKRKNFASSGPYIIAKVSSMIETKPDNFQFGISCEIILADF